MPTKKSAKKTAATAKKKVAKKTAAKKAIVKKAATRKTAAKKVAAKKAATKKTAKKKTAAKKVVAKKAAQKKGRKPQASDFVKRPSHTPAIFKPASKRPAHILFTLEEVREVLKKRPKDEEPAKKVAQKKAAKKAVEPKADQPEKASKHHAASLDDILGLNPTPGAKKTGPDNVPRKFQKYHKLLIELRDHVREELNLHSNDTLKRSQKEDAGDISISVDAGTDNFDRDFALSLLSSEQESLKEIEAAIERIYDGSYGFCEVTGEAIKPERLEAVPFTRFSLEGQRQHEMNSYKRTSRAGAFLNEASGEPITFGDDDGDN
ncbi:MAG: TraR/DksA family transcriptional regulator [Puniceicoccaceae bacterium]